MNITGDMLFCINLIALLLFILVCVCIDPFDCKCKFVYIIYIKYIVIYAKCYLHVLLFT